MLKTVKEQFGEDLVIRLAGEITEDVDFAAIIGDLPNSTVLNCKDVSRLNSLGVKTWIKFFQKEQERGVKLRLTECSPAVVEQINLILNFVCGGTVESLYLPFNCSKCGKGFVGLYRTEDLKKINLQIPDVTCGHCGGSASFDDIHEEYFRFMLR